MSSEPGRLLPRTLRDVTSVRGEDLRSERFVPRLVSGSSDIPTPQTVPATCQAICVASGKGGTGKTVVTTSLACALAEGGLRVLLFDADMGLANAHMLMGVSPSHDVSAVLDGRARMADIVAECPAGVRLVSGGSGFTELAELPFGKLRLLAGELASLEDGADVVLVDAAAGIGSQVMRFLDASHDILVVTTPDVTALLDAYALIKSLVRRGVPRMVRVIVNRARDRAEAAEAFKKLQAVATRHLGGEALLFFGWVPAQWFVQESIRRRHPVVLSHPHSAAALSLRGMAAKISAMHRDWKCGPGVEAFSARLARNVIG